MEASEREDIPSPLPHRPLRWLRHLAHVSWLLTGMWNTCIWGPSDEPSQLAPRWASQVDPAVAPQPYSGCCLVVPGN